ncbi:hypothetical protein PVL29_018256 [Vitis rotundifolia]|uniref:Rubredoxin-like domain-containing protein n=1 Tax=Vitis rotundifolia TaxID=103349 RepID=A0AA39DFR3_VITRO|nr:hypothetical protein PVL29_018256 [Vitis rotundifolia]
MPSMIPFPLSLLHPKLSIISPLIFSLFSVLREMACATTRPTFSFHLSTTLPQPSPPKPKPLLTFPPHLSKIPSISALHKPPTPQFSSRSVDVSKEDKPTSEQPDSSTPTSGSPPQEPENFDKRRLEEKFAVLNTGIYECRSCGYKYDEAAGDPSYPIPPGLQFDKLPDDWRCPTCGAAKSFFESKSVEIAGFAQNQQFGLGGPMHREKIDNIGEVDELYYFEEDLEFQDVYPNLLMLMPLCSMRMKSNYGIKD